MQYMDGPRKKTTGQRTFDTCTSPTIWCCTHRHYGRIKIQNYRRWGTVIPLLSGAAPTDIMAG